MNKPAMSKSKTGSGLEYVTIQAYIRSDENALHIQGRGPEVNRDYGVSGNIGLSELDPNLVHWLASISKFNKSMADSDKMYFVGQMRFVPSKNSLNFQVASIPYNTPYGGAFGVEAENHPELLDFWKRCVNPHEEATEAMLHQVAMVEEIEE